MPSDNCTMRRDIKHNPSNIWAILLVVCRLLPPNHLTPIKKLLLLLLSRWDVVYLCIHWMVQNTKQHPLNDAEHKTDPFLIHVGSVCTFALLFYFSFISILQECAFAAFVGKLTKPNEANLPWAGRHIMLRAYDQAVISELHIEGKTVQALIAWLAWCRWGIARE